MKKIMRADDPRIFRSTYVVFWYIQKQIVFLSKNFGKTKDTNESRLFGYSKTALREAKFISSQHEGSHVGILKVKTELIV